MATSSLWHLLAVCSLITAILCLQVTPGSDCAALCLGGQNETTVDTATPGTKASDVVCEDGQYHSTGKGIKFKNCVSCLQKSQATKGAASDASWFLYNVRYAVDVCLFDFPEPVTRINSPCIINSACRPLKNALSAGLTTPDAATSFGYCTADGDRFSSPNWWSCVRCLQSSDDQSYLSNFLIALKAGCQQKPAGGNLIGLTGQLFSADAVNITEPTTNTTMPGDGGASSTTMTTGTVVGIAVGGGLLFVGAICLFVIYCRRQRKQRARGETDFAPEPSSFTATNSRSPYVPITDHKKSPSVHSSSYNYELQEKQVYNNADYYDKMEHELQAGRETSHYNFDPRSSHRGLGGALPTHPAYIPRGAVSRQSTTTRGGAATPTPPTVRKTNTPDSYALQTYLNAVSEEGTTPIRQPPPAAAAAAVSRTPSPRRRSRESHTQTSAAPPIMTTIPPPPPGPPGPPPPPPPPPARKTSRIPSISIPSVRRMRVPKKYSPPQITVQGATPVADKGETDNMQISQPLAFHQERFADRPPLAGQAVISHVAPAREDPQNYEGDMPIRSGKSTLYG